MPEKINVIRPFVYTRKPPKGLKVPIERWFKVGAGQEIDDEMAADPFISVRFADGCIESPEQAQERARIATEKAARIQREADEANLFAKQAYDRAVAAAQVGGKLRRDEPAEIAPAPAAIPALNSAATGEATAGSTSESGQGAESKAPAVDAVAAAAPATPAQAAPAPTAAPKAGKR